MRELSVRFAACYGSAGGAADFARAIEMARRLPVPLDALCTHTFGLSEFNRALASAADKSSRAIKVQLKPDG